jgi:hypothetical protein
LQSVRAETVLVGLVRRGTGRLLILKNGAVAIVKDGIELVRKWSPARCSVNNPACGHSMSPHQTAMQSPKVR